MFFFLFSTLQFLLYAFIVYNNFFYFCCYNQCLGDKQTFIINGGEGGRISFISTYLVASSTKRTMWRLVWIISKCVNKLVGFNNIPSVILFNYFISRWFSLIHVLSLYYPFLPLTLSPIYSKLVAWYIYVKFSISYKHFSVT